MICSTDVIQFTFKNPWFLPKYEDNFAGVEGLRLYGWLFLYFGRLNNGFIYPALSSDDRKRLFDKKGNGWFFVGRDKIENFDDDVKTMKRLIRNGHRVKWKRAYRALFVFFITKKTE